MNLTAKTRAGETKGAINQLRRSGNIPAVFYSPGELGQSIEIEGAQFEAALRKMKPGRLATTIFTLDIDGKKIKAIVKDIQYHVTKYTILHIDFEELKENVHVKIKVPVECIGVSECVGIKLGGFLRQVIRCVKIKCLPKNIPDRFEVDVQNLGLKQSLRLDDLTMPKGIKPLLTTNEVVVVIAKR